MVITTECVVHDAKEAKRYQDMGISDSPPKKKVGYQFHMGDVKTLTQHFLDDEDETELEELCLVAFYDGQSVPVTASYSELSKKFKEYHEERDAKIDEIMKEKS